MAMITNVFRLYTIRTQARKSLIENESRKLSKQGFGN